MSTFKVYVTQSSPANTAPGVPSLSNTSVNENQGPGTPVGNLSAIDQDSGDTVSFTFSDGSTDNGTFKIVNNGGTWQLQLSKALNYEAAQSASVSIVAKDNHGATSSASTFTINIGDVNEAPTSVSFSGGSSSSIQAGSGAKTITTASAVDPDGPNSGNVNDKYMFSDGSVDAYNGLFHIDAVTGVISTTRAVTSADQGTKTLQVVAYDANNSSLKSGAVTYTVDVQSAANTPPHAIKVNGSTSVTVAENSTTIGTLSATDDEGNAIVAYTLTNDPSGIFTVVNNGGTWELHVASGKTLDYEALGAGSKFIDLQFKAQDDQGATTTTAETIRINVTDVNEAPSAPTYTAGAAISETAGNGTIVGTLSATDPDGTTPSFVFANALAGSNGLISADNAFRISGNQVVVNDATKIQVNNETSHTFSYTVNATDGSAQSTNSATVSVTVNDVPAQNRPPVVDKLVAAGNGTMGTGANDGQIMVSENAGTGTIATVQAHDPDAGDSITYSLFDSKNGLFSIDSSGNIMVADASKLQVTADQTYTLTVKLTDTHNVTTNKDVVVHVTNVNQAPSAPVMVSGGVVKELAANGTVVATFGASDPDGDSLTYSVSDARFFFDGNVLKVANGAAIDYEATQGHPQTITVRAIDSHNASSTEAQINIQITDAPESIVGGNGKDVLTGGIGADILKGGYGNDTLTGGIGNDAFVFNSKLGTSKTDRKVNFDKVMDFHRGEDKIWLENSIFKKIGNGTEDVPGALSSKYFKLGSAATTSKQHIVYDYKKGVLYYDPDGSGSKAAIEVAQFTKGLKLAASDFMVI